VRFTRVRDLAGLALVATLVSWLVIRQVYGDLPPFPAYVPLSLVVLAVTEIVLGWQLRSRIRRRPGTVPVQPLLAARAVALAKATSLVGAAAAGFWAGLLLYAVPNTAVLTAAGSDSRTAVVGVVCALAVAGAGLWLEDCCRTPNLPDEDQQVRPA